ncbi:MAG: hypothetical protein PHP20_08510 [Firmicutes bacterium]|nr:hypothetical protein [Bacillota bacterium]
MAKKGDSQMAIDRYMNMNVEYIYELASLAAARELSGAKLA